MKKLIIVFALFSFPLLSNAQKCKFDEDKNDPFTGTHYRMVSQNIGPASWGWAISLEENNQNFFMGVRMIRLGKMDDLFLKGEKILLKLSNDKILELIASEDIVPVYGAGGGIIFTTYNAKIPITKDFLSELSTAPITDLKVTLCKEEVILPKIVERQTNRIKQAATCLLK